MQTLILHERTLSELDHVRLARLAQRHDAATASSAESSRLEALLDDAELVSPRAVPPDVVTMYSQVLLADIDSGRRYTVTLCYPSDAEPASGFVSVLSPIGAGLLGRRVGTIARWRTPGGNEAGAEVVALLFQPEASGDYTL